MISPLRTALVTGGATGIGAAITGRLASDGVNVFAIQRTEHEAKEAWKTFTEHPYSSRIHIDTHDLASGPGCAGAVANCISRFGDLSVLVNNAAVTGRSAVGAIADCTDEQIDKVIDTNLKAPIRLARESLRYLTARRGVIVNISSIAQIQAQPEAPAYVASKAGLGGLTRALGYDLAAHGIRVVCIAPGDIETATSRDQDLLVRSARSIWGKRTPLSHQGVPDDIAEAVAWVASDRASFVTGTTIVVDGGMSAY